MLHAALVTLKECGEAGTVVHDKGATLGALGGNAVGQVEEELRKAQLQSEGGHRACPLPGPVPTRLTWVCGALLSISNLMVAAERTLRVSVQAGSGG